MKHLLFLALSLSSLFFIACGDDAPETQTVNLQIDGYTDGGNSNFVGIEIAGEEVAITLGPVSNSFQVTHVSFLFGGTGNNPATRDVILKIYKDNGTVNPGELIYSSNYTLSASNTLIQEIDLRDEDIMLDGGGSIRVGFEFTDGTGFPAFAQEFDGIYMDTENWIKSSDDSWSSSDDFGINGNWVIRATVEEEL